MSEPVSSEKTILDLGYTEIEVVQYQGGWNIHKTILDTYRYWSIGYMMRREKEVIEGFNLSEFNFFSTSETKFCYYNFRITANGYNFPHGARLFFGSFFPHTQQLILSKRRSVFSGKSKEECKKMNRILDKFISIASNQIKRDLLDRHNHQ